VDLYKENLLNLLTNIAQRRHRIKGKMVTREAAREAKETESLVRAKMEKTLSRLEALAQEFTAKGAQRRLTSRGRQQMDVVRRGLANVIPADARTLTYAEWETAVDAARIFLNATRHGDTGGLPQVIDAGVIAEVYEQVAPEGLTTQEILQQLEDSRTPISIDVAEAATGWLIDVIGAEQEAVTGRSAEIAKLEGRVKAGLDTPEGRAEYRRKQQERSRLKLPAKTAKEMPSKAEERLAQRAEERERAEHRLETVLKDFETSVMLDKEQKAREARLESQNADLQKELDDLVAQNEGLKESRLADEIRKLEAIVQKTERESIERSLAPEEPVVEAPAIEEAVEVPVQPELAIPEPPKPTPAPAPPAPLIEINTHIAELKAETPLRGDTTQYKIGTWEPVVESYGKYYTDKYKTEVGPKRGAKKLTKKQLNKLTPAERKLHESQQAKLTAPEAVAYQEPQKVGGYQHSNTEYHVAMEKINLLAAKQLNETIRGSDQGPPSAAKQEAAKRVLEIEQEDWDPVAQDIYHNEIAGESALRSKLRSWVWHGTRYLTRRRGLRYGEGKDVVFKLFPQSTTEVKRQQRLIDRAFLRAEQALIDDPNYDKKDQNWQLGMNALLEGMSPASITKAFGVTLPEGTVTELRTVRKLLDAQFAKGIANGAYTEENVVGAFILGRLGKARPHLHHSARSRSGRLDDAMVAKMVENFKGAMPVPANPAEVADMSRADMLKQLDKGPLNFYSRWVNFVQPSATSKYTTAVYTKTDGTTIPLGRINKAGVLDRENLSVTDTQLQEIMNDRTASDADYRSMITGYIQRLKGDKGVRDVARGQGADWASKQARHIMKSDWEMIGAEISRLRTYLPQAKQAEIDDKMAGWKTMQVEEFLEDFSAQYPSLDQYVDKGKDRIAFNRAVRLAMGEITNSEYNIKSTMDALASTVAMSEYLQGIVAGGNAHGWLKINESPEGWVPLAPKGSALEQSTLILPGTKSRYVSAGDIYVHPDVAFAVSDLIGFKIRSHQNPFIRGARWISGVSKAMKVVFSPLAHPRNAVSTLGIHLSNLTSFTVGGKRARIGTAAGVQQLRESLSRSARRKSAVKKEGGKTEWLIDKMLHYNLLFDGGQFGALREIWEANRDVGDIVATMDAVNANIELGKGAFAKVRGWVKSRMGSAQEAFRLEDEAPKGIGFLDLTNEYLSLHGEDTKLLERSWKGESLTAEEEKILDNAMRVAADQTADIYPTFSRTSPWVKALSRNFAIGAFPTFPAEMARTTYNQLANSFRLALLHQTPDGRTIKTVAGRTKASMIGTVRIAAKLALMQGTWAGTQATLALVSNWFLDDDETDSTGTTVGEHIAAWATEGWRFRTGTSERQQQSRWLLMPWERGTSSTPYWLDRENGTMKTVQLDYLSPYGAYDSTILELGRNLQDAIRYNDPEYGKAVLVGTALAMKGVFGNDEVFWSSFAKRMARRKPLTWTYDSDRLTKKWGDWADSSLRDDEKDTYAWKAIAAASGAAVEHLPFPEVVNTGEKIWRFFEEAAEGEHGADMGEIAVTALKNMGRSGTGIRTREFDFEKDFAILSGRNFDDFGNADTNMIRALATSDAKTYEEFLSHYRGMEVTRRKAFDAIHGSATQAQELLGRTHSEIKQKWAERGVKSSKAGITVSNFINGLYLPPELSKFYTEVDELSFGGKEHLIGEISNERRKELKTWYTIARIDTGAYLSEY
jgi:hypothetical protein